MFSHYQFFFIWHFFWYWLADLIFLLHTNTHTHRSLSSSETDIYATGFDRSTLLSPFGSSPSCEKKFILSFFTHTFVECAQIFTRLRGLSITTNIFFCFTIIHTQYGQVLNLTHKIQFDSEKFKWDIFLVCLQLIHLFAAIAFCCCHNFPFQLLFSTFLIILIQVRWLLFFICCHYLCYCNKKWLFIAYTHWHFLLALWLQCDISHMFTLIR